MHCHRMVIMHSDRLLFRCLHRCGFFHRHSRLRLNGSRYSCDDTGLALVTLTNLVPVGLNSTRMWSNSLCHNDHGRRGGLCGFLAYVAVISFPLACLLGQCGEGCYVPRNVGYINTMLGVGKYARPGRLRGRPCNSSLSSFP